MKPIPVAFHVGPLVVHTYGLGLAVTFWIAYRYFEHRLRTRGYRTDWVLGLFIWSIVAAVVGARVMHVVANLSYYRADPAQILAVWHGGLSSWGGLLFAIPTGIIVIRRRCPELRLGDALDIVAPVLAAAWALGRLLGPQLMVAGGGHPTHQWFGMYYADQPGKRLPVPIFQSLEDLGIFLVLLSVERRVARAATDAWGRLPGLPSPRPDDGATAPAKGRAAAMAPPAGVVTGVAMVLWGIERVVDESLWLSYPGHLGAKLVEAAGVALAIAGVIVLARTRRRWRETRPSVPGPTGPVAPDDGAPRPFEDAAPTIRAGQAD